MGNRLINRNGNNGPCTPSHSGPFPLRSRGGAISTRLFRGTTATINCGPCGLPSTGASNPCAGPCNTRVNPYGFYNFYDNCIYCVCSGTSPGIGVLPTLGPLPGFRLQPGSRILQIGLSDAGDGTANIACVSNRNHRVRRPTSLIVLNTFRFRGIQLVLLSNVNGPCSPVDNRNIINGGFTCRGVTAVGTFFSGSARAGGFVNTNNGNITVSSFGTSGFSRKPRNFINNSPV